MKAMVLAAGLGTRLRPFTEIRPKPLFPVLDTPLLRILIDQLRKEDSRLIVVNGHHLRQQIADHLHGEKDIIFQNEEQILGTGGGLRKALVHFDKDPVLVTNGDIFHTIDYGEVYKHHCGSDADVTLVLHDLQRFNSVQVSEDNYIVGFGNEVSLQTNRIRHLAFTGIHVINPALLTMVPPAEFYNIIDFYRELIHSGGKIKALVVEGHHWVDIGTPEDYLGLHSALLQGELLSPVAPISRPCFIGKNVKIAKDVKLLGWVAIGSGASIGRGAVIKRTVVWDGAEVRAGAQLTDTIVY